MSKKVPSLGLIGNGFINSAVYNAFIHYTNVKVYDSNPSKSHHNYLDVINQNLIMMALPTPMNKDGSVDCSIVENALEKIQENLSSTEIKPVIIKSTIPPAKLGSLMLRFADRMLLIFNPEFLTERSAQYDYIQSNRFIFGTLKGFSETPEAQLVVDLFNHRFPAVPQYWVPFVEASLTKYFTNVFFATKVALMNEFAQISESWGLVPNDVMSLVLMDPRIGRSHWLCPGTDGKKGFGGSCFIKDINGYAHLAKEALVNPLIGEAAWKKNVEVRGVLNLTEELNSMLGRASADKMTVDDVVKLGE